MSKRRSRSWCLLTGVFVLLTTGFGGPLEAQATRWAGTPQEEFYNSALVKKYQCDTCHTIMENGGTVGPILNQVGNRRDVDWLRRWIRDPQEVKPGTKMPKFNFNEEEYNDVINHLSRLKQPLNTGEILHASHGTAGETGEALFRDYDCYACHRIGREGRFVGPDLTWVGIRKTEEWESVWLKDPPAWKPGTFMPNFHLDAESIQALTAYLHALQGQGNTDAQEWEFNVNLFLNNKADRRGELVWKRFGCWSCHGDEGAGGVRNANAAPNEDIPPVREAANKYSEEQLRQKLSARGEPQPLDPRQPKPPFFCPDFRRALNETEFSDLYAYLRSLAPKKSTFRFK